MRVNPAFAILLLVSATVLSSCGKSGGGSSTPAGNPNPVFLSPGAGSTLTAATVGFVYSQTFTITGGGTAPFTFAAPGVPPGMTLSQISATQAALSGAPTTPGTAIFQLQVIDGNNQTTTANYLLTVNSPSGSITITPAVAPAGTVGTAYFLLLTASGGTAPLTWSSTGTLPLGTTLGTSTSGANSVSGTPTLAGTYTFTILVADDFGKTGTITYTVTIS